MWIMYILRFMCMDAPSLLLFLLPFFILIPIATHFYCSVCGYVCFSELHKYPIPSRRSLALNNAYQQSSITCKNTIAILRVYVVGCVSTPAEQLAWPRLKYAPRRRQNFAYCCNRAALVLECPASYFERSKFASNSICKHSGTD